MIINYPKTKKRGEKWGRNNRKLEDKKNFIEIQNGGNIYISPS